MIKHTLELERLTDLCEYSTAEWGTDSAEWPWVYTTEGVDVYSMRLQDLITVCWQDEQAAMLFMLKRGTEWKVVVQ